MKKENMIMVNQDKVLFYLLKHNFYRTRDVLKRLSKINDNYEKILRFKYDTNLSDVFKTLDEKTINEFSVSISGFLRLKSNTYMEKMFEMLNEISEQNNFKDFIKCKSDNFNLLKNNIISLKNSKITYEENYIDIENNVLFAGDIDANNYLKNLNKEPDIAMLKWKTYFSYLFETYYILSSLIDYITRNRIQPFCRTKHNICIYCKTETGEFSSIEHIVPESLGNESLFLEGDICNNCNNSFSELENVFLNTLPINILRFFTNSLTKKGKFPSVRFSNVHYEKISPNKFRLNSVCGDKGLPKEKILPNDMVKLILPVMKQQFEHHKVARVLYKIGLGLVVIDKGRDEVLKSKYNSARNYALNGGHFPNNLFMIKKANPSNIGQIKSYYELGSWVHFNFKGAIFFINLEEGPEVPITEELLKQTLVYDLRRDDYGPHEKIGICT